MYSLSITNVIKHNGNFEILEYLIRKCKIQIPESAFLIAYQQNKIEIFNYLWNLCYDTITKENALEWIQEEKDKNKKLNLPNKKQKNELLLCF